MHVGFTICVLTIENDLCADEILISENVYFQPEALSSDRRVGR
jgi:hypothetical protein